MIDFINPICSPCERRSSCTYPCLNYSNYLIRQHHEKEAQNIQDSLKTIRNEISQTYKPTPTGVTEVDISVKSGDSLGFEINDEKKEELKKMLSENQGCTFIPDSCLPKKYCKDDIENFLEYNVEDDAWLDACNNITSWTNLIDVDAFREYLLIENEKYCKNNDLCSECRAPLKLFIEHEDICGSMQESERYWSCPSGHQYR